MAILYCSGCGVPTDSSAHFCQRCGASLSAEAVVAGAGPPAAMSYGGAAAAAAPAMAPRPVAAAYGGFWIRFVALLVDMLLLQMVLVPVSLILGAMLGVAGVMAGMPEAGVELVALISGMALGLVGNWLYFAGMEASRHQATLGKLIFSLRVVTLEGRQLSFLHATGRYLAKFLSSLTLLIGYIMAGFTERKQGLHDMVAGTLVMKR